MNLSRRVFDDVSQMIGSRENPTPLVRLRRIPASGGGSIKDRTARVPDAPAYETAIRLAREEGLLVGPSTGAIVWAALEEELPPGAVAVCISPDNAFKYATHYNPRLSEDGNPEVEVEA